MSESFLVAIEICPLCSSTRRKFTCSDCVQKGNFIYSNKHDNDSFIEKKNRKSLLVQEKEPFATRIEKYHTLVSNKDRKRSEIFALKLKLNVLKEAAIDEENAKNHESQKLRKRKNNFKTNWKRLEELKSSNFSFEEKIKLEIQFLREHKFKLDGIKTEIIAFRKRRIRSLLSDIFPIFSKTVYSEFGTPPRATISTRDLSNDLVLEASLNAETDLEDATKYTYEGGQWIETCLSETEYCIVEPGAPLSGDYVKYYDWLRSHRKEVRDPESDSDIHTHPALGIPAALMYTAQAVQITSCILDVNLPAKIMSFGDFGDPYICHKKLMSDVSKLNTNIMYLCFSQLINKETLQPMQTIRNLDICLSKENTSLGHIGSFEINDFYIPEIFNDSDSSLGDLQIDSDSDNEYISNEDWDSLKDLPDLPKDFMFQESQVNSTEQSLSASATGLVTSAAASVASLWPWKKS